MRIHATYWLETCHDPLRVAEVMAGEQSTGTFIDLPLEISSLVSRQAATVERVDLLEQVSVASLPAADASPGPYKRALVEISWNEDNFGRSLPNLMATVAGNLFELRQITGLRLVDLTLPDGWATAFDGPQFGVAGTRALSGVSVGPLVGTIIKPSVGLSPDQTADMVRALCEGGIDFIKDDELQANGPHCPFDARAEAVMRVIRNHADRTGKKVMYAFNITDDIDAMLRHHDKVLALGGSCIMLSLNSVGAAGALHVRKHAALPIHGHRNGWGYLGRSPGVGFDYRAWQIFWRLAGVDHLHVNGLRNKFSEADDSVIRSARACLTPLFPDGNPGFEVMPVFSSGQWAGQAHDTYRQLGSADLIYTCGGGIVAHPGGIGAGVHSIREAWDAALDGITLEQAARESLVLRQAIETFG